MFRGFKHNLSRPTIRICESNSHGATHSLRRTTKYAKTDRTDWGHIPVSILRV